jgi:phospholipid/cholesterol/gamma-HCH transport system ATP-binding protein
MQVSVEGVWKSFGPKQVLRGVDLEIKKGESLVVIGGSGSGKSVLMRCMIGLNRVDKGAVRVGGKDMRGLSAKERRQVMRRIGVLFQAGALFDSLPVWKNVAFAALQHDGASKKEAMVLAQKKLEDVGLGSEVLSLSPAELSGGMQKRVALARAVASEPELIYFDEPTTGLDPVMSQVINELIVACRKKLGSTTFAITHDMRSAFTIADRIALLHEGVIRWQGPPDKIREADDAYLQRFIAGGLQA